MDNQYPPYQYSKFFGKNKEEQLVIRADTFKQFKKRFANANKIINKKEKEALESTPESQDAPLCSTHQVPMRKNKWGKYFHSKQDENGNWVYCNGNGFKE